MEQTIRIIPLADLSQLLMKLRTVGSDRVLEAICVVHELVRVRSIPRLPVLCGYPALTQVVDKKIVHRFSIFVSRVRHVGVELPCVTRVVIVVTLIDEVIEDIGFGPKTHF